VVTLPFQVVSVVRPEELQRILVKSALFTKADSARPVAGSRKAETEIKNTEIKIRLEVMRKCLRSLHTVARLTVRRSRCEKRFCKASLVQRAGFHNEFCLLSEDRVYLGIDLKTQRYCVFGGAAEASRGAV
jgi:hypothetical protein